MQCALQYDAPVRVTRALNASHSSELERNRSEDHRPAACTDPLAGLSEISCQNHGHLVIQIRSGVSQKHLIRIRVSQKHLVRIRVSQVSIRVSQKHLAGVIVGQITWSDHGRADYMGRIMVGQITWARVRSRAKLRVRVRAEGRVRAVSGRKC